MIQLRKGRVLKQFANNKKEPRFDQVEMEFSETENSFLTDTMSDSTGSSSNSANFLMDDPILRPKVQPVKENPTSLPKKKTQSAVEEILYVMLVAKPNKPYVGYELLQALLSAGLRFGAMNIFHYHEQAHGNGKILFSIASASEPGTFEINKMGAYSGKGLMLFMRLSTNKDLMPAFELMLETGKQLIEDLDGDILDDERKVLTPEKIDKMKTKIIDFEQKQVIGDLFDS
jgi:cell division protein ZipA